MTSAVGPAAAPPVPPPRPGPGPSRRVLAALALVTVIITIAGWFALDPGADMPVAAPPGTAGSRVRGPVRRRAPDGEYRTFEGATAALMDLRGMPVVLNFWRSDCPPCVYEMPDLEDVRHAYEGKVEFLGLATREGDEEMARKRARDAEVQYHLGFDDDGRIARAFGIVAIPTTFLIDREGRIAYRRTGAMDSSELVALIKQHLLGQPADDAEPA